MAASNTAPIYDDRFVNMANDLESTLAAVRRCTLCAPHLPMGPRPIIQASESSSLLIVGQAPGTKVHLSGIPWNDNSGSRLREWLGIAPDVFHDPAMVAIVPVGMCYPGVAPSGGDNPPRKECAPLWHPSILPLLPDVRMTILVGLYAHKLFLGSARSKTLTATVADFSKYLPRYLPLPHPSWRSVTWERRNPWFGETVLPAGRNSSASSKTRNSAGIARMTVVGRNEQT